MKYDFNIILNKQTPKAEYVKIDKDKDLILAFTEYASKQDNCAGLAANQTSMVSPDAELISFDSVLRQKPRTNNYNGFHYDWDAIVKMYESIEYPGKHVKEIPNPLDRIRTDKAFFVINKNDQYPQMVFINPKVIKHYENKQFCSERCLTWPDKKLRAFRYDMIDVEYTTIEGKQINRTFDGFQSQVFQHECNHIDGIPELFEGGKKVGRNEPCPCMSGKKFKKCCLNN